MWTQPLSRNSDANGCKHNHFLWNSDTNGCKHNHFLWNSNTNGCKHNHFLWNYDTNGCKHNHFLSKYQHGPFSSLHHLDFCARLNSPNDYEIGPWNVLWERLSLTSPVWLPSAYGMIPINCLKVISIVWMTCLSKEWYDVSL